MKRLFIISSLLVLPELSYSQEVGELSKPSDPESCNMPGRYQYYAHPTIRADQYLIDTCLGRVWQQVTYTDLGKTVWTRVPRLDTEEELVKWAAKEVLKLAPDE